MIKKTYVSRLFAEMQTLLVTDSSSEEIAHNKIITQLLNECPLRVGDTAFPKNAADYEKYGAVYVSGIAKSVKDLGPTYVWPKNNNPMLLTVKPRKEGQNSLFCTTNWLTKHNEHLQLTC